MDLREYQPRVEPRHPWEIERVEALRRMLTGRLAAINELRVLDIGCGDGFTVSKLFHGRIGVHIDSVDINLTPAQINIFSARYPTLCFHSSLTKLHRESYDVITLFDVLEHTEDAQGFLRSIKTYGRPGWRLLITVPAFQSLFSSHDLYLGHHRRYSRTQLCGLIKEAEVQILDSGYLFSSLIALRALTICCEALGLSSMKRRGGLWLEPSTTRHPNTDQIAGMGQPTH